MKAILTVRLLGVFSAEINHTTLHFRSDKTKALFIYLLLNPSPLPRDTLATLLWPDQPDSRARKNLRDALFYLRKALTPDLCDHLHTNRKTVQLKGAFDVDTTRLLDGDASVVRGELLEGFHVTDAEPFMDWLIVTRERWYERSLAALTQSAETDLTHNNLPAAQSTAQRLLQFEPWRESAHRLLMEVFARQGQTAAALQQYERCSQILQAEMGLSPTATTVDLYYQIKQGEITTASEPPNNLPAAINPLVGRSAELEQLTDLLAQPHCRLITITGLGGMGKTALLLAFGRKLQAQQAFAGGVFFVPLLDIEEIGRTLDPSALERRIATHILETLDIAFSDDDRIRQTLATALRKRDILLLIDNWEQLLDGAPLLPRLLEAAPRLHIVATSREPLQVVGEHLLRLGGMTEAAELFVQRAQQVGFRPMPTDQPQIDAICHTLGGHPLAIEMAASWLRGLSLVDVAASITLDFLTSTTRTTPTRHRDIRTVFAQSWQMLSANQQNGMAQLAVFRQPFNKKAARAVVNIMPHDLAILTSAAWLQRTADGRYTFHELVRQFCREQLDDQPTLAAAVRVPYINFHFDLLTTQGALLPRDLQGDVLRDLRQVRADIAQAWGWAVAEKMLTQIEAGERLIGRFYNMIGDNREGIDLLQQAIVMVRQHALDQPRLLANLLVEQAVLYSDFVTSSGVPDTLSEVITIAEQIGDDELAYNARANRAFQLYRLGHVDEARSIGIDLLPKVAAWRDVAINVSVLLGSIVGENGEFLQAANYFRQALALIDRHAEPHRYMGIQHNLAIELTHIGRFAEAQQLHEANLAVAMQSNQPTLVQVTKEGLGEVLLLRGEYDQARTYLLDSLRGYQAVDDLDGIANASMYLGNIALVQGELALAKAHYQAIIDARTAIGQTHELCQGWAGLAMVALQMGNVGQAIKFVERVVPLALEDTIRGEDVFRVYWHCYHVLASVGHAKAKAVLERAVAKLLGLAGQMSADAERETFLWGVECHRLLLEAYDSAPKLPTTRWE